ncbi:MAG: glycosyltransferase [Verrucomicrobia bacterium]|nr:glycosyltransferase [Verrucomicrobiota bacterium]
MPDASDEIVLVTPVWNDAARFAAYGPELAAALASAKLPLRWVIADDGSSADERVRLVALLADFSRVYPKVILHHANAHRGKGSIVREAWALVPDAAWYAFVDADGSVSARDMIGLLRAAADARKSVMGIRRPTTSTPVAMGPWRGIAHRGYRWLVHAWLGLSCEDPQCGAKVILGNDYRRVVHELRENGFAFDSELLVRLVKADCEWREIPVGWTQKKGGKIRPLLDAWGMIAALWRLH